MENPTDLVATRLEAARKELLDLGLRNPLLNYRLLRSRGLEVVDELQVLPYGCWGLPGSPRTCGPGWNS